MPLPVIPGEGVFSDTLFSTGQFLGCIQVLGGVKGKEGPSSSIISPKKLFLSFLPPEAELNVSQTCV